MPTSVEQSWGSSQDTYTHKRGVSPNTVSEISSKTKIYATASIPGAASGNANTSQKVQVGVIASFDPNESRTLEQVRGIGFGDQIAEVVPGVTDAMTISVTRTAQYLTNMYQAFGYHAGTSGLVRSLKHHRWPFDIEKETVFSELVDIKSTDVAREYTQDAKGTRTYTGKLDVTHEGESLSAVITVFEGCWFSNWSTSYSSDSALVQENCELMVSDVYAKNHDVFGEKEASGNSMLSARFAGGAF